MIFVYLLESFWLQWNESVLKFYFISYCNYFDLLAWRWASKLWMQCICERYQSYLISKQIQKICLKSKSKIKIKYLSQLILSDLQASELLVSSFLVSSSSSWTHIIAEKSSQIKMTLISSLLEILNFFKILEILSFHLTLIKKDSLLLYLMIQLTY